MFERTYGNILGDFLRIYMNRGFRYGELFLYGLLEIYFIHRFYELFIILKEIDRENIFKGIDIPKIKDFKMICSLKTALVT